MAAILGVSPWSTSLAVWYEKTQGPGPDRSTLAMRRGLALEDFIAAEFEREKPSLVTFKTKPIVHEKWGFPAGASVDRLVAHRMHPRTPTGILEAKTAFKFGWRDWDEKSGDLPDAYYVQQQWYMAVTGLPVCWAAADVGDYDRLRIIEVRANDAVQARCIEAARKFWKEHVLTGVPPEPSGSEGDAVILRELYHETVPEPAATLDDPKAAELLRAYREAKARADEAHKEAEAAKQRLCALLGEHEKAIIDDWLVTWQSQERRTLDVAALRREHPEIAERYERVTHTRVFGPLRRTT